MQKFRLLSWSLIISMLLVVLVSLSYAQESADPGAAGRPFQAAPGRAIQILPSRADQPLRETLSPADTTRADRSDLFVGFPEKPDYAKPDRAGESCVQILANTQLDVLEFVDGGTAEPWDVLDDFVYFSSESYVSPEYSLFMADADVGDPSPLYDAFGQGFFMPDNLTLVRIEYETGSLDANPGDLAYGNLLTLDQDGFLQDLIVFWTVGPSEGEWSPRFIEITDQAELRAMNGQPMALVFDTETDNGLPDAWVFYDDIKLIACFESGGPVDGKIFFPAVMQKFGQKSGPTCLPPTESPRDQYNANRGLVQTGAQCDSTLSSLDRADYYTFKPTSNGKHTLHLRDLPAGTEWSAMIFIDKSSPEYAPGPTGGQCRIGTPGAADKQVTCTLSKNTDYFVKVSAGGAYDGPVGSYEMKITGP